MTENRTGGRGRARMRLLAVGIAVAALAVACSTSNGSSSGDNNTSGTTGASGTRTASYKGVTANTIKIGFVYPDLESLAKTGIIKVDNGPYAEIMQTLVDDVNKNGGVDGRKLELHAEKYSVLTATDALAVCTKLTEDNPVFAVLGFFSGVAEAGTPCVAQQHATMMLGNFITYDQATVAKARAPMFTTGASSERSVKALVKVLDQQGLLKGKTIGAYAAPSNAKPLLDLMVSTLKGAGYTVKDTAINDAPPTDNQAIASQDKVIANRFKDQHIDTVIVVGSIPPGTNFDTAGYHPSMLGLQSSIIAAGAFTNPYAKFPIVAGLGVSGDLNVGYDTPVSQHCRAVYKAATGKTVEKFTVEQQQGKTTGFSAMNTACSALTVFVDAAKKAGTNLTYDSFTKAIESLGTFSIPETPVASFGPNKHDAQDSFQLLKFNPAWKNGGTAQQFLPIGTAITQRG